MGGNVWVKSQIGEASTFEFDIQQFGRRTAFEMNNKMVMEMTHEIFVNYNNAVLNLIDNHEKVFSNFKRHPNTSAYH
jgi:hypothetical protein